MRKKAIYRLGTCILMAQLFLTYMVPCHASEIGSGAYPAKDESVLEQLSPPASSISSVSISPGTTIVSKGSSYAFVAFVTGQNDYSREVSWSVDGQTSQNTYIDGSGILHVGSDENSSSLLVKAVSRQDSNYSATALATVQTASYSVQVKASPDHGGSVSGGGSVREGGSLVITAAPYNGFTFGGWLLNGSKVSDHTQYTVENIHNDSVYIADFKPADCQINVSVNDSNAGTVTESRTVRYGESITLEAVAKNGYQFDSWMENGAVVSTDSRFQLQNITGSRNLTAMFSRIRYDLTLTCWPASTGTVSGQGVYDKGSNVKITAAPADGYRFVSWSENGNVLSTGAEYSIQDISRDMFLLATFEKAQTKTYSITASVSSANGKIVPEGKSTVSEGSGMSYVIMPKDGYMINTVYVDGKSVGAVSSYSFSGVKENHTISAEFVAKPGQSSNDDMAGNEKEKEDEKAPDQAGEGDQNEETQELTGTLQHLDISLQEAEQMIEADEDAALMKGALESGDLKVTVQNDFVDIAKETSSVTNLEAAARSLLTKEEKLEMLQGNDSIVISLSIDDTDGEESQLTKEAFEKDKLPGLVIGRYFEVRLTKSGNKERQAVSELAEELKVVINVPRQLQADDRKFYILRLHTNADGSQEYAQLSDEDENPETITFSTDRFSPYAIAYMDLPSEDATEPETAEHTDDGKGIVSVIVIMAVAIAAVITIWLVWYLVRRKK